MRLRAPEIMSLSEARDEFLGFIYEYHWRTFAMTRRERGEQNMLVIDLKDVRQLSLDAALVLTAEYHRRVIQQGNFKPFIDDREWAPDVRALLEQLGFYSLVDARGRSADAPVESTGGAKFVQFVSGQKVEQTVAKDLIDRLAAVAGRDPERQYVYAALVEAIKNVRHHAYPPEELGAGSLPTVSRWWAAAAFDPDKDLLQFVVYDQGVGIPTTLPRQPFINSVLRFCPPEWKDADLIAGGIRLGRTRFRAVGRSRFGEAGARAPDPAEGRGNGLWTICHMIPQLQGSQVRIVSGRGEAVFAGGRAVSKLNHNNPFCGTLIEWNLKLPAARAANEPLS
jgi:hypothetical protein